MPLRMHVCLLAFLSCFLLESTINACHVVGLLIYIQFAVSRACIFNDCSDRISLEALYESG